MTYGINYTQVLQVAICCRGSSDISRGCPTALQKFESYNLVKTKQIFRRVVFH